MSSESIVDKLPGGSGTARKLELLLKKHAGNPSEFTLNYLCDEIAPQSREILAMVLGEFVRRGMLKQIVRVESPSKGGGIKDYDSIERVPEFLYDPRADREIEVNPDDLLIVYTTK